MGKNGVKKVWPILFFGLICLMGLFMSQDNKVIADSGEYYLAIDGEQITNGSTVDLSGVYSSNVQIAGNNTNNITNVEWSNTNSDIATLSVNADYKNGTLLRKNPGFTQISAIVETTTSIYTIYCIVKYDFEFYEEDFSYLGTNKQRYLIFHLNSLPVTKNPVRAKYKTVKIDGSGGSEIKTQTQLTWSSSDTRVVKFDDASSGVINPVGAGTAIITVTSNTASNNTYLKNSFEVIVTPGFKLTEEELLYRGSNASDFTVTSDKSILPLFTNAKIANDLKWDVYSAFDNKKTTLIDVIPSSLSRTCDLILKKAGIYDVYASVPGSNFEKGITSEEKYAHIKVRVPLIIKSDEVVMNVGDQYNIFDNSNAPSELLKYINTQITSGSSAISINSGVVTANQLGTSSVTINLTNDLGLFTGDMLFSPIKIEFKVVDAIAISMTEASMYNGSTMTLDTVLSNPSIPVVWKSLDETVATVVNGVVTAKKVGSTKITASQTIQGVLKTSTCNLTVKSGVTKIVLDPAEQTVNFGEYLTIFAEITPVDAKDIDLRWVSSNDSIVKIKDEQIKGKTVTVQGISGGVAVISAIDRFNVVVGSCKITVKQKVTGITLSETSVTTDLSLKKLQIRATVTPDNAHDKTIKWTSSDIKVATVDQNGMVTLLTTGKVTIIATSVDNPSVQALCNIGINVPVASFTLDSPTKTVSVGQTDRITYNVSPTNATLNTITWTSTNSSIASVDNTGNVTGKAVGQAVIIARSVDGGIIQYCTVTVTSNPTAIKLDKSTLSLKKGAFYNLIATLTPIDATNSTIKWESSNTKVATVSQTGKVDALSAGITIIMAKNINGDIAYCNVEVLDSVTGILLNYSKKTISKGKTFKLIAKVLPETASNKAVIWSSSDTKVATVSNDGTVKGIKGGMAVITCKTAEGNYAAICVISVKELVTTIKLNKSSYKLAIAKSYTLKATVSNSSASDKGISWKSSNTRVATVNSKGKVTAKRLGYSTITATTKDGSDVEASCEIRVVVPASSISLNKTAITMVEGRNVKLKATIKPKTATYKTANWTSSDKSVAVVGSDGEITALKEGTAMIKATVKDSTNKSATCFVNVIKNVPATSVTILNTSSVMVVGETAIFQHNVGPATTTDTSYWFTDNSTVASINKKTGKLTAKKPGIANITVSVGSKSATVKVTVVGLNRTSLTLEQYDPDYTLSVEGVNSGVNWIIDNPSIALISNNGVVSARKAGTAIITATVNGKKLRCKLTVTKMD